MKSLHKFKDENFITAIKAFFEELKVPVNYIADEPINLKEVLGERYKTDHPLQKMIAEVYMVGIVDDAIFVGKNSFSNIQEVQK